MSFLKVVSRELLILKVTTRRVVWRLCFSHGFPCAFITWVLIKCDRK